MTESSTAAPDAEFRGPSVLQVLPALVTGGVERSAVDVAVALAQAGLGSVVASAGGPMTREIERAGVPHIAMPLDSKNPLVMRRNATLLADVIEGHGIDIVHARSRAPAWSARAAARRTGRAFVTTFHGVYSGYRGPKRWYNAVMTRADRVIANSAYIADHIAQHYRPDGARVRIVPRGIDVDRFSAAAVSPERVIQLARQWRLPDDQLIVMLPGRLTRWKGQAVLIEALARLDRRNLRCLLVGSDQGRDAYRRELVDTVHRWGLDSVVQITGHCDDMPAAYMLADVVVSASTDPEAFGRVAVEAQAMGRPVIATDHGGARETVLPGSTGWLVPPGDPAALAEALENALSLDAAARAAMAERAVGHVGANFTKAGMCARTLSIYDELHRTHAAPGVSGPA